MTITTIHFRTMAAVAVTLIVTAAPHAQAQDQFDFYGRGPYRASVPRPDDLLGYGPGEYHTQYLRQEAVLDALIASAGDRVRRCYRQRR